jgi:hypothetical protein
MPHNHRNCLPSLIPSTTPFHLKFSIAFGQLQQSGIKITLKQIPLPTSNSATYSTTSRTRKKKTRFHRKTNKFGKAPELPQSKTLYKKI